MKKVGQFEKVSYEEFKKNTFNIFKDEIELKYIYKNIKLPKRATRDSAGYDFFLPFDIFIKPFQTVKIPTGIRVKMERGWFLALYPRSSLGFKYRLQFDNTICIIDGDYYYSSNQGHILVQLTNDSKTNKELYLQKENRFMQGIFCEYALTYDDNINTLRDGGIGSSD